MLDNYNVSKHQRVLFISVHPDDETLGCGGAILKHIASGDIGYWLNLTSPTVDHPYGFSDKMIEHRRMLVERISSEYGFKQCFNLDFPTQMLDTVITRDLVGKIDDVISAVKPEVIYLPNRSDVHSDHRVAFHAVYSCTKNFRKPYIRRILMYETLSETEFSPALSESAFIPNTWIDISMFFNKKLEIMRLYESELMPDPLPRSIHAISGLGAFRGARIGAEYAESFELIFEAR